MPNYCNNHANIYGSVEKIKAIADVINSNSEKGLFESLVPECEDWGCKWDVSIRGAYIDIHDEEILISFETAWNSPINFFVEMAKKYKVSVNVLYDESGCDFAGEADIDEEGGLDDRCYTYLEGLYQRGSDMFYDEVRSQLDYLFEDNDEPPTKEYVEEWLHFMNQEELIELIREYEDKLAK